MSTTKNAEQHAHSAAGNILNGVYETWKEGRSIEQAVEFASRVLGVDERTIDNAMLYALTDGRGFVPTAEGAVFRSHRYRYAV